MSNDIVTRLRHMAWAADEGEPYAAAAREAADEIERLSKQAHWAATRASEWKLETYQLNIEIDRLRAVVADRDEWNDQLAGDVSDLLMAIPKPFRKWLYLRSQRVREARRG